MADSNFEKFNFDQLRSVLPHVVHVILRTLLFCVRKICEHYLTCDSTICLGIQTEAEEQKGGSDD